MSILAGRHSGKNKKLRDHIFTIQKKQRVAWSRVRLLTVPGDVIPPARFLILKVLPTEDQLFKYISPWVLFFFLSIYNIVSMMLIGP